MTTHDTSADVRRETNAGGPPLIDIRQTRHPKYTGGKVTHHTSVPRRFGVALTVAAMLLAACGGDEPASEPSLVSTDSATGGANTQPVDAPGDGEPVATADEPSNDETTDVTEATEATTDQTQPDADPPAETPANGDPIAVGAVVSLTGPAVFPEASAGAAAYFESVNEHGGIAGRPIEYTTIDDGGDPAQAASAARSLVADTGVVALTGGASLLECAVNAAYYEEQDVRDIPGTGVDPGCFASANISPVNTGPYLGVTVSLYYLSEVRGIESLCYVQQSVPSFNDAFSAAADQWSTITGRELALPIQFFNPTDDVTPLVVNLRDAGCEAVFMSLTEAPLLAFMQALRLQGAGNSMVLMSQTSGFTDQVAQTLGDSGQGLMANSEFLPYNSADPALDEWRSIMEADGVPLTSFAIGGYLAAKILVDTMSGIDGEVNRASVNAALLGLADYESLLLGNPYSFGEAKMHSANRSSKIVVLQDGVWSELTDEWISLPAS